MLFPFTRNFLIFKIGLKLVMKTLLCFIMCYIMQYNVWISSGLSVQSNSPKQTLLLLRQNLSLRGARWNLHQVLPLWFKTLIWTEEHHNTAALQLGRHYYRKNHSWKWKDSNMWSFGWSSFWMWNITNFLTVNQCGAKVS